MADFLLELLTEEIPARMQARAAEELGRLLGEALAKRGLSADIETHVTPRRLVVLARGLPVETAPTREERRGPRADAPPQAIEGFLRSTGLARAALEERADPKGRFLYAVIETPGRRTADVLPDAVAEAVTSLPWPKSMRWGAASASMDSPRWVRPLTSILALLDAEAVPPELLGLTSGRTTRGHRFMGPANPIEIESAATYVDQLRAAHVILSAEERRRIIREGARAAAEAAGLTLIEDEGLVAENAGLTEWPVPLLGRFDPAFLDVPREVIQLTMRTNQKYFACAEPGHDLPASPGDPPRTGEGDRAQRGGGALAPAFICVANIVPADGGAVIIEGNRRVLAARLSDARFFWEQDVREWREAAATGPDGLWAHFGAKLERVTFHEKLGTMRDKAERVAKLARWLVESGAVRPTLPQKPNVGPDLIRAGASFPTAAEGSPVPDQVRDDAVRQLADQAERAALLAKADLVSAAVGEFPELQGIMGGYYARACGEEEAVAAAIRDHYKPVGPSDAVPTDPVTVAVSVADKLDTLIGFFRISERPTGSRDPFALRRATLGIVRLITANGMRLHLRRAFGKSYGRILEQAEEHGYYLVSLSLNELRVLASYKEVNIADRIAILRLTGNPNEGYVEAASLPDDINNIVSGLDLVGSAFEFVLDRLRSAAPENGIRHDVVRAVYPIAYLSDIETLGEIELRMPSWHISDDIQALLQLADALQAFISTEDGRNLLAAYRRAANILAIEGKKDGTSFEGLPEDAADTPPDRALRAALDRALPAATAAIQAEDFAGAMAALATLRAPIDSFFEGVMVNDPAPAIRAARLALLARFVGTAHAVADFSKIEG